MNSMKYLITGGAGFIGSHIARRILNMGHQAWVVDNILTGAEENIPESAIFVKLDLSDQESFKSLPEEKFDAVLHLAAQSSGAISHEKPAYDLLTNTLGTLLLLNWCSDKGIKRFIYASSMSVYGRIEKFPVSENECCRPYSFYGITKLAAENYINYFKTQGMQTTVFRMFNVYGPGQNLTNLKQGMVSIYLAYLLKDEPILVLGSKDRFRDFIYIDDVVDAWISVIDNPVSFGKTYNLASGKKTFVWELLNGLIEAMGHEPDEYPITYGDSTPGDQFGMHADISLITSELDWSPKTDLRSGLQKMADWAKSL